MSFLDKVKSLFSGRSDADEHDQAAHQLQSPTQPEPTSREPTEAEIAAAAAATPTVAPVDPHPPHGEPAVTEGGVPDYEGVDGPTEGEPLDGRADPAP
jgi:hypothetical protein